MYTFTILLEKEVIRISTHMNPSSTQFYFHNIFSIADLRLPQPTEEKRGARLQQALLLPTLHLAKAKKKVQQPRSRLPTRLSVYPNVPFF